jgi:hypothetical protein
VLVVLALIVGSVLIGRWSASMQVAPAGESDSRPAFSIPGSVSGSIGQSAGPDLPGRGDGGGLMGAGTVCLLARPC